MSKVRFKKGMIKSLYYVKINDIYAGFVFRSGNVWKASRIEGRFATRREAAEALAALASVEAAAQVHYGNATNNDPRIAAYDSPVYMASKTALKTAIKATYPDMDVEAVYDTWIDCGESIFYCVDFLRQQARELAAEQEAEQVREAAYEAEQTNREATVNVSGDTLTLIAVYPECVKVDGYTRLGTPFARVTMTGDFNHLVRQANIIAAEFADWVTNGQKWTVTRRITFPTPTV
jgi:hypothetical protein